MLHDQEAEQFMRAALAVAAEGLSRGELPVGAVVVLNGAVIASAHTMERSARRLLVHADYLALDAADRLQPFPGRRRDAKLFVTLEPCLMCLGAAMTFGVGEVYYALESPSDGAVALMQQWQRREVDFPSYQAPQTHGGLLRDDAQRLFRTYVAQHSSGAMWEWARTVAAL
jgi:tRNA(adenine34) deaminase